MGYFWSMDVVCYYLRVNQNCNVVFLDKLKDPPGVVDGDVVECSGMEIAFGKISHWNQLNVCFEKE